MQPKITDLPELKSADMAGAREWYASMADLGALWHPDDPADDIETASGQPLFSPEAADRADDVLRRLHAASASWPDPGFLYDLAGTGRFAVEAEHPGFEVDACVPGAGRTGYVALKGQALPTLVVEECGRFAAVRFLPGIGTVTGSSAVEVVPLDGASFSSPGIIDASGATPREDEAVTVEGPWDAEAVEAAIERCCDAAPAPAGMR